MTEKNNSSILLRHAVSLPFIYIMIFPIIFLHFMLEIYHQACFRLYHIPLVDPWEYFVFDRQLMGNLNNIDKANCVYCSYVNNFFQYAAEIAARTERYWCPLKYEHRIIAEHSQYEKFLDGRSKQSLKHDREQLRDFSDLEQAESDLRATPHKL